MSFQRATSSLLVSNGSVCNGALFILDDLLLQKREHEKQFATCFA